MIQLYDWTIKTYTLFTNSMYNTYVIVCVDYLLNLI